MDLGQESLEQYSLLFFRQQFPNIIGRILAIGQNCRRKCSSYIYSRTVAEVPKSLFSSRTLAVHMYSLLNEGLYTNQAYATAVILLVIVLIINGLSGLAAKKVGKE